MIATMYAVPMDYDAWKYYDHYWTWISIYTANKKQAYEYIDERKNVIYDDKLMNIFMRAYLEYRIELKTQCDMSQAIKNVFKEADEIVYPYVKTNCYQNSNNPDGV